jgi:plastocyanin
LLAGFSFFLLLFVPRAAQALNDCLEADFQNRRGLADVRVVNDNPTNPFVYRPRCMTISEGTRVQFAAIPEFGMHPLYGGTVSAGQAIIDPNSPIGSFTSGTEGERVLLDAGEFPYFCDFHFGSGMMGSIRVVPQLFADGFD